MSPPAGSDGNDNSHDWVEAGVVRIEAGQAKACPTSDLRWVRLALACPDLQVIKATIFEGIPPG